MNIVNTPSLVETQRLFWASMGDAETDLPKCIYSDDKFSSTQRIAVYKTNARSLHISVLKDAFPICRKILGDNYFVQISKVYFKSNPSISFDLNQYGETFSEFLDELIISRPELADYQYLGDLARLEWKIQSAYFSKEDIELDLNKLEKLCRDSSDSMRFHLQPSVSIISAEYPVLKIWTAHQDNKMSGQQNFQCEQEKICVYRKGVEIKAESIDTQTYCLLTAIKNEKCLSEIADHFDSSELLNSSLAMALQKKWLSV